MYRHGRRVLIVLAFLPLMQLSVRGNHCRKNIGAVIFSPSDEYLFFFRQKMPHYSINRTPIKPFFSVFGVLLSQLTDLFMHISGFFIGCLSNRRERFRFTFSEPGAMILTRSRGRISGNTVFQNKYIGKSRTRYRALRKTPRPEGGLSPKII